MMEPEVLAALACPHDGGRLLENARVLGCPHGHRFDLARQGYATLTASRPPHGGDSPAMLDRRMRVHEAGVLTRVHAAVVRAAVADAADVDAADVDAADVDAAVAELADAELADAELADADPAGVDAAGVDDAGIGAAGVDAGGVGEAGGRHDAGVEPADDAQQMGRERRRRTLPAGIVCEVGAGPGTYLAAVLDAMPDRTGLAVDVAKAAARRAARCHTRANAIVADVWDGLPLRAGSVAVLLDVFAPRNAAEFARLVVPGGTLVVATAEPDHLAELRERFGMLGVPGGKGARIAAELAPAFAARGVETVRTSVPVTPALAVDLATMGPSGHHLDPQRLEAVAPGADAAPIDVTVAATVTRFVRRTGVDIGA
ncbi:MAG: hypothetical protein R6U94_13340 [Nitriliruptoraceae bacterium]